MPHKRDDSYIDERYKILEWYRAAAPHLTVILANLGCWRAGDPRQIVDHVNPETMGGEIWLNSHRDSKKRNAFGLYDFGYDPEHTKAVYGKAKTVSNKAKSGATSKVFRNSLDSDTEATWERSITRRQVERHEFSKSFNASITTKTEISGSYGGASVAQSVEATFGFGLSMNTIGEDEVTKTDTLPIRVPLKAHSNVLAVEQERELTTETPFSINGIITCKAWIDCENWARGGPNGELLWWSRKNQNRIVFDNFPYQFLRMLHGYDPRYPRMKFYPDRCSDAASKAWDWFEDPMNRSIVVDGVKRDVYSDNVEYRLDPLD